MMNGANCTLPKQNNNSPDWRAFKISASFSFSFKSLNCGAEAPDWRAFKISASFYFSFKSLN